MYGRLLLAVLLTELVYASSSIHNPLLTGEEGVALGADIQVQILASGTGLELGTATASYRNFFVLGMNIRFHGKPLLGIYLMPPPEHLPGTARERAIVRKKDSVGKLFRICAGKIQDCRL